MIWSPQRSSGVTAEEFFDEPEERSVIKSTIVARYFDEWTRVMLPQVERRGTPLAYVDLFSGPGRYDDGTPSTPLWVLGYATNDPRLCERLITVFNDKDPDHARRL